MRHEALSMLLCCTLVGAGRPSGGETVRWDWPGWRGTDGNSITTESGWRPEALLPTPSILWRARVGDGYSSVCIKGLHLFTMGSSNATDSVYCLEMRTGREVWRHSYACKPGPYVGTRATPLFVDGLVYTVSREGDVYCLRAEDGVVRWHRNLVREANARVPTWGIASSAVRHGNSILVNAARYGVALDRKTGEILWQSPEDKCGYASPVLYDAGGRPCMVAFGRNAAHGVDVQTGDLLWTKPWVTRLEENSADPVVRGDLVFISSIYSKGCTVFRVTGNEPTEVWLNRSLQNKFGTSVLFGEHLYGVHGNTGRRGGKAAGTLRCVEFATGRTCWEYDVGFSSLIVADGQLVILTERGELVIAEATPDAYHELARGPVLEPGEAFREARGKCWTAPVLCRGKVFCRNDRGQLVCVDMVRESGPSEKETGR